MDWERCEKEIGIYLDKEEKNKQGQTFHKTAIAIESWDSQRNKEKKQKTDK